MFKLTIDHPYDILQKKLELTRARYILFKKKIKFHPYKSDLVHRLRVGDSECRILFIA